MSRRLGLIVNPVAGMGGAVGLKGTDGPATLARARALGAVPRAGERATAALRQLSALVERFELITCPGPMGEASALAAGLAPRVVLRPSIETPTAAHTRAAAAAFLAAGVELLLFAGGDGTARDVLAAAPTATVLGIPTGVKMRSGVFAPTPARAGEIAAAWLQADTPLDEAEIVDLDEADLLAGRTTQRLFGILRVPAPRGFRPATKASPPIDDASALDGLARELAAGMAPGRILLFGPGTTTARIMRGLGIERPSLLGVDAVRDRRLIGRDLSEAAILDLLDRGPTMVVAGVVGGQGFLFGRGNQPLSARVLARVGRDAILVVAGLEKLTALEPPRLLVDTGEPEVDQMLAGWMRVAVGPGRSTMIRVEV